MRASLIYAFWLVCPSAWAAVCPVGDINLGNNYGLGVVTGTSTCGMNDDDDKTCGGTDGEDFSVTFTPPMPGDWAIGLQGSTFDTVLQVRDPVDACSPIECNDDAIGMVSYVEAFLPAFFPVHISVEGYNGACGDFTLNIQYLGPGFELSSTDQVSFLVHTISGARPNTRVYLLASTTFGTFCHPSGIICSDLDQPRVIASGVSDASGSVEIAFPRPAVIPPNPQFQAVWIDVAAGVGDVSTVSPLF
jgi:hypothetical protein